MFKPMLAGKAPKDLSLLRLPVIVSPKLDGVRALIVDGWVMSRNMKQIPNDYVQNLFGPSSPNGLDGELIVGDPTDPDVYLKTMSGVMSVGGRPDVCYYVFDTFGESGSFEDRYKQVRKCQVLPRVLPVPHYEAKTLDDIAKYEEEFLKAGYEGLMIRSPEGPYKHGRSTTNEGWLLKLKRFEDSEAVIIGVVEQLHNGNEMTRDALGRAKHSSCKGGKVGKGTLGALQVMDVRTMVTFEVGTGFDDALRAELWAKNLKHPEPTEEGSVVGHTIKYKFFPSGSKDKPRFPVFCGFRSKIDL